MPTDDDGPWHTLRVIRERSGFGQAAPARASTMSRSYLCDLELGRRWPTPEVTVKLNVSRVPKHAYIYKARLRAVSLHQGREDRNGLSYSEIDVTEDQSAADRLRERGFQTTPVVNAGDEWCKASEWNACDLYQKENRMKMHSKSIGAAIGTVAMLGLLTGAIIDSTTAQADSSNSIGGAGATMVQETGGKAAPLSAVVITATPGFKSTPPCGFGMVYNCGIP